MALENFWITAAASAMQKSNKSVAFFFFFKWISLETMIYCKPIKHCKYHFSKILKKWKVLVELNIAKLLHFLGRTMFTKIRRHRKLIKCILGDEEDQRILREPLWTNIVGQDDKMLGAFKFIIYCQDYTIWTWLKNSVKTQMGYINLCL